MLGRLIPPNLFSSFINIFENPFTIVFIHRWFAFVVLAAVIYVYYVVRKNNYQADLLKGLQWLVVAVILQITLGILTILSHVNIVVALLHQAGAIALFALSIYFIHRFRALDAKGLLQIARTN
jgi:cytochrome c oxidase assembly protein subunit 15